MITDVWRMNNPLVKDYTWFKVGSEKRKRLYYFLTSSNVPDNIVGVGMEPADNMSDHGVTWIELGQTEKRQGRGFWRINNLFLTSPTFLESTNSVIRETIMEYSVNDFNSREVDDHTLSSCEMKIFPILLLEMILAKVR